MSENAESMIIQRCKHALLGPGPGHTQSWKRNKVGDALSKMLVKKFLLNLTDHIQKKLEFFQKSENILKIYITFL